MENAGSLDRTFEIALAGLLHDVGKFAQRAGALRQEAEPELYCPLDAKTGRRTHHHAAVTAAFVDRHLPWLRPREAGDQHVVGFAARHHAPATVHEWIVAVADRWASGMDRGARDIPETTDYWREQVLPARLVPILFRLAPGDPATDEPGRFGLEPFSVDTDVLMPGTGAPPDAEISQQQYRHLWDAFVCELNQLSQDAPRNAAETSAFLLSFAAIYEKYAWCIPAATDEDLADVSLFDHSRAVAAIAAALYRALGGNDERVCAESETSVRDTEAERLALVVGDLSGIQGFLYTIASERAAKTLRGRSLALQLLTDAIAARLLERVDLPATNVIYAGGGKVWLLIHASGLEAAREFAEEVDAHLFDRYGTRLSFSLGATALRGADFAEKRLGSAWSRALEDAAGRARARLRAKARESFERVFGPRGAGGERRPCRVCAAEVAADEPEDVCGDCRSHERLGQRLPHAEWLVRSVAPGGASELSEADFEVGGPVGVAYRLERGGRLGPLPRGEVAARFRLDDPDILSKAAPAPAPGEGRAWWFLGRSLPVKEQKGSELVPLTYDELAERGEGAPYLGILRMDVDDLGKYFSGGAEGAAAATLSRLAVLSRQIAYFFSGHVGWMVGREGAARAGRSWHQQVQVVYSGGDDLFLVGAWSPLAEIARELRERFERFSGRPSIGISGGLAVVQRRHPIAGAAELAGELEDAAKRHRRPGSGRKKDALAVFETGGVLSWNEAALAAETVEWLRSLVGRGDVARSVIFRLQDVARSYRERESLRAAGQPMQDLAGAIRLGRWAWVAQYALPRALRPGHDLVDTEPLRHPEKWLTDRAFRGAEGERPIIAYLDVIARWAELATRRGGE